VAYQIGNNTKGGDIVLDLFGGSGSTMVAAHKLGRTAYLMELDERYVDVIVQRMAKLFPDLPITRNGEHFAPEVAPRGKA
jgi:DNA modification methylase